MDVVSLLDQEGGDPSTPFLGVEVLLLVVLVVVLLDFFRDVHRLYVREVPLQTGLLEGVLLLQL